MLPERVEIVINFGDGVPIYRQVVTQIHYQVASGVLEADAPLPSIRALAHELKVARNTIAKAYEELQQAGLVRKRRGFGTFVSLAHSPLLDPQQHHIVEKRIDSLLAEARQLNLSDDALLALIRRRQAHTASGQSAGKS